VSSSPNDKTRDPDTRFSTSVVFPTEAMVDKMVGGIMDIEVKMPMKTKRQDNTGAPYQNPEGGDWVPCAKEDRVEA
jgi:hypothetical protein